jgi:ribokinase
MYDVITVGSATVDAFARTDSELIKIKSIHHEEELIAYPCGSKILMSELIFLTGGGGTNVAVSLSRLGHKVAYLGKIGNDINGKIVQETLKKERVKFIGSVDRKHLTGYSVILDSLEGDRSILAHKGANNFLNYDNIDKKRLQAGWFYFSSMMDESYTTLEKLSDYAVKNGIKIAFNPSNYLAEKGAIFLGALLRNTEILVLNKEEAQLIVKKRDIPQLITGLMELGPKVVVITDGKSGAFTLHDGYQYHVIPEEVTPVETTGAGDSFASGFLSGWMRSKGVEYSLQLGVTIAQSVIQHVGAKTGLLTEKDAAEKMRTTDLKVVKKKA